ncbi:protein of unknown function [Pustulibacterium marinum]|uniref:DUF4252 domain-containing protein n=1 Tax=Pustulibacterium marinum TaxID=1224947 RepID=A0A1I7GLX6_9FLAO|nr:DUF4252 domain-containing protein [Pustulibacterium marinum]SFU49502.1 protein of unknown function [Pustulibacterium marinum]
MKKLFLFFGIAIILSSCASHTPYDTFREENEEEITFSINASNFLVNMFVDKSDLQEFKSVVSGIKKYRVLVGSDYAEELNHRFDDLVNTKGYERLFYVKKNGENVQLYLYKRHNKIKEVICKIKGDENFVVLSAQGNIKVKDVDKLMNEFLAEN